jgi:hypothetical protein
MAATFSFKDQEWGYFDIGLQHYRDVNEIFCSLILLIHGIQSIVRQLSMNFYSVSFLDIDSIVFQTMKKLRNE